MKTATVYIITNTHHTTLYIGITSNLLQRVYQHRCKLIPGFSARYNLFKLVYYEHHEDITEAILREKRLKEWRRPWKNQLISEFNPHWRDLYDQIL